MLLENYEKLMYNILDYALCIIVKKVFFLTKG